MKKVKQTRWQFDAISVREDSGVRICKESFGVEAVQMLDPTLLLDVDDYRKLVYILGVTEENIGRANC